MTWLKLIITFRSSASVLRDCIKSIVYGQKLFKRRSLSLCSGCLIPWDLKKDTVSWLVLMTVQLKKSAFLCYIATQVSLVWICFRANQTDPNHYLHYISAVRLSLCAWQIHSACVEFTSTVYRLTRLRSGQNFLCHNDREDTWIFKASWWRDKQSTRIKRPRHFHIFQHICNEITSPQKAIACSNISKRDQRKRS